MHSGSEAGRDPFATHFVDLALPGAAKGGVTRLCGTGLVTVSGLATRTAVAGFAREVMKIARQRDSGPDGLTAIDDTDQHSARPGLSGRIGSGLALHTEGSALVAPPRLALLVCTGPAPRGGQVLLVDSRTVHMELAQRHPDAVAVLSGPRAGFFGPSTGIFAPVFARDEGGRVSVRYRQDSLVRWNPLAQMHLHAFRRAAERNQQMLALAAGQGCLMDNHRWLHACAAFEGPRRCYLALGDPHDSVPPGCLPARSSGGVA
ncbi:TauD/TfdA family dioxygenase [Streptomyces klenkii]